MWLLALFPTSRAESANVSVGTLWDALACFIVVIHIVGPRRYAEGVNCSPPRVPRLQSGQGVPRIRSSAGTSPCSSTSPAYLIPKSRDGEGGFPVAVATGTYMRFGSLRALILVKPIQSQASELLRRSQVEKIGRIQYVRRRVLRGRNESGSCEGRATSNPDTPHYLKFALRIEGGGHQQETTWTGLSSIDDLGSML